MEKLKTSDIVVGNLYEFYDKDGKLRQERCKSVTRGQYVFGELTVTNLEYIIRKVDEIKNVKHVHTYSPEEAKRKKRAEEI